MAGLLFPRLLRAALFAGFALAPAAARAQTCKPAKAETDVIGVRIADEKSTAPLGDLTGVRQEQDKGADSDFPFIRVLTRDGAQEARFFVHYGAVVGAYAEIEVSRTTVAGAHARKLPIAEFATERGVKLGLTDAALVALLGPCHKTERIANRVKRISYLIEDGNHPALKRSGYPSYFARYDFRDGRLVNFRIGFEYP